MKYRCLVILNRWWFKVMQATYRTLRLSARSFEILATIENMGYTYNQKLTEEQKANAVRIAPDDKRVVSGEPRKEK